MQRATCLALALIAVASGAWAASTPTPTWTPTAGPTPTLSSCWVGAPACLYGYCCDTPPALFSPPCSAELNLASTFAADTMRSTVIQYIWKGLGFPTRVIGDLPGESTLLNQSVDLANIGPTGAALTNFSHMDTYREKMPSANPDNGVYATLYFNHYFPAVYATTGKWLVIINGGHAGSYTYPGDGETLRWALSNGWEALQTWMPSIGPNTGSVGMTNCGYSNTACAAYILHDQYAAWDTSTYSAERPFTEPQIVALNTILARFPGQYAGIAAIGISGGGRYVLTHAMLDPRINVTTSVTTSGWESDCTTVNGLYCGALGGSVAAGCPLTQFHPATLGGNNGWFEDEEYVIQWNLAHTGTLPGSLRLSGLDRLVLAAYPAGRQVSWAHGQFEIQGWQGIGEKISKLPVQIEAGNMDLRPPQLLIDPTSTYHQITDLYRGQTANMIKGIRVLDDVEYGTHYDGQFKPLDRVPMNRWFQGSYTYAPAGTGSTFSWTFLNVPSQTWKVSATWVASTWATNAQYQIYVNGALVASPVIDQSVGPVNFSDLAANWQNLSTSLSASGTVEVRLLQNATGPVVADAMRLEPVGTPAPTNTATPNLSVTPTPTSTPRPTMAPFSCPGAFSPTPGGPLP